MRRRRTFRSISVQGAARQGVGPACLPARSSWARSRPKWRRTSRRVANAKQKSDTLAAEAASLRQKLIDTAARIESLEREDRQLDDEIARLETAG